MLKIRASALPGFNHCMKKEIATQFPELLNETGFEMPEYNKEGVYKPFGVGMKAAINYMLTQKISGKHISGCEEIGINNYEKEFERYDEIIFDAGTANKEIGKNNPKTYKNLNSFYKT